MLRENPDTFAKLELEVKKHLGMIEDDAKPKEEEEKAEIKTKKK